MSYPKMTPTFFLSTDQTVPLLSVSIPLEELSPSHIMNTVAEKWQRILGTLPGGTTLSPVTVSVADLLLENKNIQYTLHDVIKKEMPLKFTFENVKGTIGKELKNHVIP